MAKLNPNYLHEQGLAASLSGEFDEAKSLFNQARASFVDDNLKIEVGRVDRDMARVFAGLGEAALRDGAIENAFEIHWAEHTKTPENITIASELAATEHVRARVALAQMVERHERHPVGVGGMWRMAYRLLGKEGSNQDYLEQVVAHGSLALATFGRNGDLHLAAFLAQDPIVEKITDPKRAKAVKLASQILLARHIFVPVHLIPQIREKVIGAVAGPYLTKG